MYNISKRYRICRWVISTANKDGDKVFNEIVNKINNNDKIEKQDLITLTFTPIMGGKA